jgi:general secretion pathway protein G
METCANCGRSIADSEQRYFDNNRLVCGQCLAILRPPPPPPGALGYAGGYQQQNKSVSGLGIAALVLGILGVLVAWVPFCGIVAIPVAAIGLILGIIAIVMARSSQTGMGLPIAGTTLSAIAILLQGVWWVYMAVMVRNMNAAGAFTATPTTRPTDPVAAARFDVTNLNIGMAAFYADHGRYPTPAEGINALLTNPNTDRSWVGPYGQNIRQSDPWGRPYVYRQPGKIDPNGMDVYSLGPDGIDGTADDVTLLGP